MAKRRDRKLEQSLARGRVEHLLALAEQTADVVRSTRYVGLARRIAMRYQMSLPRAWRRRVCRSCQRVLRPGANARVRLRRGRTVVSCSDCGHIERYPHTMRPKVA